VSVSTIRLRLETLAVDGGERGKKRKKGVGLALFLCRVLVDLPKEREKRREKKKGKAR